MNFKKENLMNWLIEKATTALAYIIGSIAMFIMGEPD